MDKRQQLIEEAKRRYSQVLGKKIHTLPYPEEGIKWGSSGSNDHTYKNSPCGFCNQFWYNEEKDTLTMWGAGLALIYHKGQWARIEGQKEEEPILNYQIY